MSPLKNVAKRQTNLILWPTLSYSNYSSFISSKMTLWCTNSKFIFNFQSSTCITQLWMYAIPMFKPFTSHNMPYRGFWPHFKAIFNFLFMTCKLLNYPSPPSLEMLVSQCTSPLNSAQSSNTIIFDESPQIHQNLDIDVTPYYNINNNFKRLQKCTSVLLCKSTRCCLHFGGISHWQPDKIINTLTKPTICNSDPENDWNAKI